MGGLDFLLGLAAGKGSSGEGSSGGGLKKVYSTEVTVSTTSTSEVVRLTTPEIPELAGDSLVLVHIRDKDGPKNGNFYESYDLVKQVYKDGGTATQTSFSHYFLKYSSSGVPSYNTGAYGVYASQIVATSKTIKIAQRYSSSISTTIDGTFTIDVYILPTL